jgi:hypothetical protein
LVRGSITNSAVSAVERFSKAERPANAGAVIANHATLTSAIAIQQRIPDVHNLTAARIGQIAIISSQQRELFDEKGQRL